MITFELNEKQEKELKEWQDAIKKVFGEYGSFDYIFTPTGVGNCVKVYSHLAKTELELTDVDSW